eukprot:c7358_g1_i1.p1 GENE.c7358_g1_i1~~c7358_g1_i1.p1  ORF type:complete len:178 (+),score=84.37 c7358_g1_i1:40-534(+)
MFLFRKKNKFRGDQAALKKLGLSETQLRSLQEQFMLLDKRGTGEVTTEELEKVLKNYGFSGAQVPLSELIEQVDTDGSKSVDFVEFATLMSKTLATSVDDELRWAFSKFDKDGDGHITGEDIRALMSVLGKDLDDEQIEEMVKVADVGDKGFVSFEDFIKVVGA